MEFTKIRHFEITKQKICPLPDSFPGRGGVRGGEGEHPLPHTLHFELALMPLTVLVETERLSMLPNTEFQYSVPSSPLTHTE